MEKLLRLTRIGLTTAIALSLTINLIVWQLTPQGYLNVWLSLAPNGHINDLSDFIFRLASMHIVAMPFVWIFGQPEAWRRMQRIPGLLRANWILALAFLFAAVAAPFHLLSYFGNLDARALTIEDAPLEDATAWFELAATGLLVLAAFRTRGSDKVRALLAAAAVFFLLGMEEISWGQRIFDLASPEIVQKYNYQNELNLHNFFNPVLTMAEMLFFVAVTLVLFYFQPTQALVKRWLRLDFAVDETDAAFFIVFLLALPVMPRAGGEIGEEYFGAFAFTYALRRAWAVWKVSATASVSATANQPEA